MFKRLKSWKIFLKNQNKLLDMKKIQSLKEKHNWMELTAGLCIVKKISEVGDTAIGTIQNKIQRGKRAKI